MIVKAALAFDFEVLSFSESEFQEDPCFVDIVPRAFRTPRAENGNWIDWRKRTLRCTETHYQSSDSPLFPSRRQK